jgi:NitT/TauT family transport system permease protein
VSWFPAPGIARRVRLGWVDLLVFAAVLLWLLAVLRLGGRMAAPMHTLGTISLSPSQLPLYAGESLLRIFIAFLASLIFAVGYGYLAAKSPWAGRVLVPLLDILQSVPVLGFLSATLAFFAGLFPGSSLGLEIAAVFAIFTAQAWNMTFAFYHTLVTLPRDLEEASHVYRLGRWSRLWYLELPSSAITLVLNSMMSFGGSWFFLAASETVTFSGRQVMLPGIGSYMALAEQRGDVPAMVAAVAIMILMIVLVDQLFWRPIIAWSQRFKLEQTPSADGPTSFVLTILRRSVLVEGLQRLLHPAWEGIWRRFSRPMAPQNGQPGASIVWRTVFTLLGLLVLGLALRTGWHLLRGIALDQVLHVGWLGILTWLRVTVAVLLGAVWTVPVGVAIGLSPRVGRWAQPLAQIAASFPANMLFPIVVAWLLRIRAGLDIGAIPLMMLGTQWYILFNVIAGSMAIPQDLKEAGRIFGLRGGLRWRRLILPAIFPSLVTGGVTAAGGAWNASIVAEVASWQHHTLVAHGLGAYITLATAQGQGAHVLLGIAVMSLLVIAMNRLVWRPLYHLAETRYHLD